MGIIYKPSTHKGPVLLSDREDAPPTITLPSGQVITAIRGDRAGGTYYNEGNFQWAFPSSVLNQQGAILSFGGQQQVLDNSNMSYRGGSVGSLSPSSKGAIGGGGFAGGGGRPDTDGIPDQPGFGGSYAPNQVGQYGFAPADLTSQFPSPFLSGYNPINAAPFKFTDVSKFAKQYGQFNREELNKNFNFSKGLALDTLDTELQSLQGYAPAAAALKRNETSIDNQFNQQQRTSQIDTALPGVRNQSIAQGQRAESYANGRIPDPVQDRAFELGVRSSAADNANAGGFGANSSVARKASDLMSAAQRVDLSKYGDQLLGQNIQQRYNNEVAPTEFSNAGSQINVNPPVSYSQLQESNFGQVNQATIMPTGAAFTGQVQQNQFVTGLEQQTRQFNASNTLQNDQFNAGNQNNFALQKFGYQVGEAGAFAGAAQTNLNTGVALDQQAQAAKNFQDYLGQAQQAGTINSITQGLGSLIGGFANLFSGGGSSTGTNPNAGSSSTQLPGFSFNPGAESSGTNGVGGDVGVVGGTGESSDFNFNLSNPGVDTGPGSFDLGSGALDFSSLFESAKTSTGIIPRKVAVTAQDTSKGVLATAGIHDQPVINTTKIGVDNKGNPIYSSVPLAQTNNPALGGKLVEGVTSLVAPFKVLSGTDNARLHNLSINVSNPNNINSLDAAVAAKNNKAFVGQVLKLTGQPSIDTVQKLIKDPTNQAHLQGGVASAYTASQLFNNWPQMSAAQKAISLASLGVHGYQTATGERLGDTQIVKPTLDAQGKLASPGMTVSQSLDILGAGYNSYSLAKNWGDLTTVQKVAGLTGDAAALASTARSMGMEGYGTTGAAVPNITPETIKSLNGVPAPQYGVGSLQVPAGTKVPVGYQVTGKGADGRQIITPSANMNSSATNIISGLETAAGVAAVYSNWGRGGAEGGFNGALGGSAIVGGLAQMGQSNPYLLGGIIAASTVGGVMGKGTASTALQAGTGAAVGYGAYEASGVAGSGGGVASNLTPGVSVAAGAYRGAKILGSNASNANKASALRRTGEDTVAGIETAGLSNIAQFADAKLTGGKGEKLREKIDSLNPVNIVNDKIASKVIGLFGHHQNAEHSARDEVRGFLQKSGTLDKDKQLTLADGSKVSLGENKDTHDVTNPDQLSDEQRGKVKKLHSYDVDYTNDLDFAAHMGGVTLSRLLTGGVANQVEQLGNQLGNASLKNVGYNKPLTSENYSKVMQNQRAIYSQSGIKSKSDALQLANQAYSEKRLDAVQHATAVQAVNMVFDDNSFSQAQKLMSGRNAGIQAVPKLPVKPVERAPEASSAATSFFKGAASNSKLNNVYPIKKYTRSVPNWQRNPDGSLATGTGGA